MKLKSDSYKIWTKVYGGGGEEYGTSIIESIESSVSYYVTAGTTNSFGAGQDDCFIIKVESDGDLV